MDLVDGFNRGRVSGRLETHGPTSFAVPVIKDYYGGFDGLDQCRIVAGIEAVMIGLKDVDDPYAVAWINQLFFKVPSEVATVQKVKVSQFEVHYNAVAVSGCIFIFPGGAL